MSSCNIDHSVEDVTKKLHDQQPYLPGDIYQKSETFLKSEQEQQALNELFHLLKKYDLATQQVKEDRNKRIKELINN